MLKRLHLLPIAALCLSLYLPARADETRDKLRGLVRLPPMSSAFKFSYSHLDGYTLQIAPDAPTVTPDSLRKMLHGNATDAFLYYRIGSLCNDNNKPAEAKAAYAQSVALYRQQVKAAPADGLTRVCRLQRRPERSGTDRQRTSFCQNPDAFTEAAPTESETARGVEPARTGQSGL